PEETLSCPSSLQTDNVQTDRQPPTAKPGAEELLTLYKLLRAHGIAREEARPVLKSVLLPLDNNLWRDAAPPPAAEADGDDTLVTPFAGRPTKRSYYPDEPSLEYQPPN